MIIFKILKVILEVILFLVVFMFVATAIYGLFYYHTQKDMKLENVKIKKNRTYCEIGDPETAKAGFIFYPGGKVGFDSYNELLSKIAKEGYFCVVMGMPVNLAVLHPSRADKFLKKYKELYPNIENWYIGGHSLGGTIACKHAVARPNTYKGVVFLAAYPDKNDDMNGTGMKVLSMYGSKDNVFNMGRYTEYHHNFPEDFEEIIIEGANHGQFGNYGFQKGDNEADISHEEQIGFTAKKIVEFMN
ncbi:MAG: alpha/beta hydrolase [Oscillospiraceae bacterium]|nr:alpha/beta hydrolase [Oscillospiraceae bacterium]